MKRQNSHLPAMPWFPADYDTDAAHLSIEEDCLYRRLIDWYWRRHGRLTADPEALAALTRYPPDLFKQCWTTVREFWVIDDGWLRNARADHELKYVSSMVGARRDAGRKGGQASGKVRRERSRQKKKPPESRGSTADAEPEKSAEANAKQTFDFASSKREANVNASSTFAEPPTPTPTPTDPDELQHVRFAPDDAASAPAAEPDNATGDSADPAGQRAPPRLARAGFDQFWAAYPVREHKKRALEVWIRKRLADRAPELIADVERRKRQHRRWLEGFIPHASSYLTGERWTDEIDHSPPKPTSNGASAPSGGSSSVRLSAVERVQQANPGGHSALRGRFGGSSG